MLRENVLRVEEEEERIYQREVVILYKQLGRLLQ
jgi:hypothetical protein